MNERRLELAIADPATRLHEKGILVIDDTGDRKDGSKNPPGDRSKVVRRFRDGHEETWSDLPPPPELQALLDWGRDQGAKPGLRGITYL